MMLCMPANLKKITLKQFIFCAFRRLSGISPFLGDNDNQTLRKVILGKYLLDCDEFSKVSSEAKDFISRLLILNPKFIFL